MRRGIIVAALILLLAGSLRAASQHERSFDGAVRVLPAADSLDLTHIFFVKSTLAEMVERSTTFAELMSRLDAVRDVVVFVQMAALDGKGLRGNARFQVAPSGVVVGQIAIRRFAPEQVRPRVRALAHELAHAYEVACIPRRTTTSELDQSLAARAAAHGREQSIETPFAAAVEAAVVGQWWQRLPAPSQLKTLGAEYGVTGCDAPDIAPVAVPPDQPAALSAFPRIRSHSVAIERAIADGTYRSPTFRALVERIQSSDGLVYIEDGLCRAAVRSCLTSVGAAGPYRLVRILIDTGKAPGCALTEAIGHELQHAVEVLSDPKVMDSRDLFHLFSRIGPTGVDRFETPAAIRAGLAVATEACRD